MTSQIHDATILRNRLAQAALLRLARKLAKT